MQFEYKEPFHWEYYSNTMNTVGDSFYYNGAIILLLFNNI